MQEKILEEGSISAEQAAERMGRNTRGYGHYQSFGDVELHYDLAGSVDNYQRTLSLHNALAEVRFEAGAVNYKREYFASYPDKVLVARLSADQSNSIHVTIALNAPANRTRNADGNRNELSLSCLLYTSPSPRD